jgi:hypothetical protein
VVSKTGRQGDCFREFAGLKIVPLHLAYAAQDRGQRRLWFTATALAVCLLNWRAGDRAIGTEHTAICVGARIDQIVRWCMQHRRLQSGDGKTDTVTARSLAVRHL